MAEQVLMPRQGQSVESCLIVEWKKQPGDAVSKGDVLLEVETDKATFEVEAETDGTLLARFYADGDDVPVLSPIAAIGEPGEKVEAPEGQSAEGETGTAEGPASPTDTSGPRSVGASPAVADAGPEAPTHDSEATRSGKAASAEGGAAAISPRARHLAQAKGVDPTSLTGSGPGGRVIERDVVAALGEIGEMTPTARAKAIAEGLSAGAPSGAGARVRTEDLASPVAEVDTAAPADGVSAGEAGGKATDELRIAEEVPLKGVRKRIADNMLASLRETAQLTLNSSADARALLSYRKTLKNAPVQLRVSEISINDLILYVASRALPRYPEINAHLRGDRITQYKDVHLGFAVDTDRGLMVPTVRFANRMSLKQLAAETKRLADACIQGKITPDELGGASFTVSNLGSLGIETFTPVLNPPQVGILGVGTVEAKPAMRDEDVEFIPHISLSLTFDHRALDGAPAARFLKDFAKLVASVDAVVAG
jgi:pyruvate dehydrogenase E2 component (dihydrolipoamide acetyltransferase)